MFRNLIILLTILQLSTPALSETYIYLTNNTDQKLTISTTQHGDKVLTKGKYWWQHATEVAPYATVRFLEMNRDTGITSGKYFYFDSLVTAPDGSQVKLQQYLKGTWNFSKIGHGTNLSPWYTDRGLYSTSHQFNGNTSTVAFRAQYARVNGDDIYYVIQPQIQTPTIGADNNFKLLSYNVWALLKGIVSKQVPERLSQLPAWLKGYDAIVFSELFDNSNRQKLLATIASEFPYQTKVVDRSGSIEDGGVLIASRWPISVESQITYNDCRSSDCLSAKGVMYARINKNDQVYNVFATHAQAFSGSANVSVREKQFRQLKSFIDSRNISSSEPVIIAGDLNVDRAAFPVEYMNMLNILNATEVPRNGGLLFTADGSINHWNSDAGEILDYVLYSKAHLSPGSSQAKVIVPRSISSSLFTQYDLSDHFAVYADMQFNSPQLSHDQFFNYGGREAAKLVRNNFSNLNQSPDAMVNFKNGKSYIFKGSQYWRYNNQTKTFDSGYPLPIKGNWGGVLGNNPDWYNGIDAAVKWNDDYVYFFKGDQYIWMKTSDETTGQPTSIASGWKMTGAYSDFASGIDAAMQYTPDTIYLFKGDKFIRYSISSDAPNLGPLPIVNTIDPWGAWTKPVVAAANTGEKLFFSH